jgi:uncharacterized membrane protein YphA (DoxX/SURF4 family)
MTHVHPPTEAMAIHETPRRAYLPAALNTTLIAGLVLLLGLPMRPVDWFLMLWPWGLVGALALTQKWSYRHKAKTEES